MNRTYIFSTLLLPIYLFGLEFSVESIVNTRHSISDYYWNATIEYSKDSLNYIFKNMRKSQKYKNQPLSIPIPDSLAEKAFSIQKGEVVTQIYDNQITGTDTISEFEAVMDQNGEIVFYFTLKNLTNRHIDWYDVRSDPNQLKYYFYIIGDVTTLINKSTFEYVLSLKEELINPIVEYFINNSNSRSVAKTLRLNMVPDQHILNRDSLENKIQQYCSIKLTCIDIDSDSKKDIILEANPNDWRKGNFWDFAYVILSTMKEPFFVPFSFFEFSLEINGDQYLMFRSYYPETGMRGRKLIRYNITNKKLESVFYDGTWST